MEGEFSKNMRERLAKYKLYLEKECRSPFLQKDKLLVDREPLWNLISDLEAYYAMELPTEADDAKMETVQQSKEQILRDALWKAEQIVQEANTTRDKTLEEAHSSAKTESEKLISDAKAYDAKVRAEAEEIVGITLQERRKELEDARKELEDSRSAILEEAKKKGEALLAQKETEAEELRKQLDSEIELYRKSREEELKETLRKTQQMAQETLEEKTRDALKIYANTVHQAEEMVNLMVGLYEQQMEIIQQDRREIRSIVERLERQGLKRRR